MTIREVESRLGITRANVRFYEKEGLLFPRRNPLNDYRDYSEEDLKTLEKIIFLRNLGLSVEKIRMLEDGTADMPKVLGEQVRTLEEQQKNTEVACRICKKLLSEENLDFNGFALIKEDVLENKNSLKDALSELGAFWEKLVVWGFLALQIFYTVIIFPMLPEEIPVTWQGSVVTEYSGRWHILLYLLMSVAFMYGARVCLYRFLAGGLRCYMDEINALVTAGAVGIGFSMEVFTVLSVKGVTMGIGIDGFVLLCAAGYLLVVFLICLFCRKRGERR